MRAKEFIVENDNTKMTLWHGGNLTDNLALISQKKGRFEYGSGLYATTHWGTANKYSKGSRKLYKIILQKGNDANSHSIDSDAAMSFVDQYVVKAKRNEVKERIQKRSKNNQINAETFNNIILNNDAIRPTNTKDLSEFLVSQGIDYLLVPNAFGWGEMMVVIFNMRKIVEIKRVQPKEKIDTYDLPTEFSENKRRFDEQTELPPEYSGPMRQTYIIPGLSAADPYNNYRFGVAMARARSEAKTDDVNPYMPEWTAETAFGEHGVISGMNGGIKQVIDKALIMTNTPGGKKLVVTPDSDEPKLVNNKSPMVGFKGYKTKRDKKNL